MHYVIVRDDDTNALTPPECLERLYRPFLDHGLAVNLSVIPNVNSRATTPNGEVEGFLLNQPRSLPGNIWIGRNEELVQYLLQEDGYCIAQHGYEHLPLELDRRDAVWIRNRLRCGTRLLRAAGFPAPAAFVAPHDRFTRQSISVAAKMFPVVSTGFFDWRRVPVSWWPGYARIRFGHRPHWRRKSTVLLSHPGCLLSKARPFDTMLQAVREAVESRKLTVLVTHWWEYFAGGGANEEFIAALHAVADYLASATNVTVVSFDDIAAGVVPLDEDDPDSIRAGTEVGIESAVE